MGYTKQDDKLYVVAFVNFLPGAYDAWQAAFDDLGAYVWAHEPTTETYYFGLPLDFAGDRANTAVMLAFEVYATPAALDAVHFVSEPMRTRFLPAAQPLMPTPFDLRPYSRAGGFLYRGEGAAADSADSAGGRAAEQCGLIYDVALTAPSEDARDRVLARLGAMAAAVRGADGLLTCLVLASTDDARGARLLLRFRDAAAHHAHSRRPAVLGFWAASKAAGDIARVDQRAYVENGKGWLHR